MPTARLDVPPLEELFPFSLDGFQLEANVGCLMRYLNANFEG